MLPNAPDEQVALQMLPLLERGREALRMKISKIPKHMRPIGMSIDVITEEDFAANAMLLLHHVCSNGAPTHVLCKSGVLCALIAKHSPNW